MHIAGTPIDGPRYVEVEERDLRRLRERMCQLEAEVRRVTLDMALMQQGVKERLDEYRVLLTKLEAQVVRQDV